MAFLSRRKVPINPYLPNVGDIVRYRYRRWEVLAMEFDKAILNLVDERPYTNGVKRKAKVKKVKVKIDDIVILERYKSDGSEKKQK